MLVLASCMERRLCSSLEIWGGARGGGKKSFVREPGNSILLKIAILGTRGIPANYGGFETFAEECSARLASRGHDVTVYCRSHYVPRSLRTHRRVKLVVLPTVRAKYTDTVVHTFLSVIHSCFHRFDVLLICNAANTVFALIPRVLGTPVAVNVDGLERRRRKWGRIGKAYYLLSEFLSTWIPHVVVTDARVIREYYRRTYGCESVFIPYGCAVEGHVGLAALSEHGLEPRGYFLYVSRLEPENNADLVIRAFEKVRTDRRLVLVGDAPYADQYIRGLQSTQDPRVVFTGAIYGEGYRELMAHALCYVHATEVGGTHPALVEAMGRGSLILANGTAENAEALGGAGILYEPNDAVDLARRLQEISDRPEEFENYRSAAQERARTEYAWDRVVDEYERLFRRMARRHNR